MSLPNGNRACTGFADEGHYECPARKECKHHKAWPELKPQFQAMVMAATKLNPCPYFQKA